MPLGSVKKAPRVASWRTKTVIGGVAVGDASWASTPPAMPSVSIGTSNQTRRFISRNLLQPCANPAAGSSLRGRTFSTGNPAERMLCGFGWGSNVRTGRSVAGRGCADRDAAGAQIGGPLADKLGAAAAGEEALVAGGRLVEAGALAGE